MKRKITAILLASAVLLGMLTCGVSADWSTTTDQTCYKDSSPNTEMYMVTDQAYSDYVYYGAKYEPEGGVYYGRVCLGGNTSSGYGVVNAQQLADESAVSFYTSLDDSWSMQYWSYLYGKVTADGEHVLLMNLNFNGEGADCPRVTAGNYDTKLITDFKWLATIQTPVFLRIGAEVNVWDDMPSAGSYIAAYRHIAELAHQYCPNVALLYAPNNSSSYRIDLDSFYPGDDYVDWIGASLYYCRYANNGDTARDAFYGVNTYADAVLKLQQVVNLSRLHKKPVMVTEGGPANYQQGTELSSFAADRVRRAYAYLTMVYPELKCMIYSDTNFGDDATRYEIYNNATVTAAYNASVASNPTLLHSYNGTASYYTKVSAYTGTWEGTIRLAAYTYTSEKLTAVWYLDGSQKATVGDYPYAFSFDADALNAGSHTVKVVFSNGQSRQYSFTTEQKQEGPFRDVCDKSAYYYTPVVWASEHSIVYGTDDTHFSPEETCTRAQVVTFLYRAAGSPDVSGLANPFTDVQKGSWYYNAVLWGYDRGIVYGTDDTHFSPDTTVSRAQFVTFLWRYAEEPVPSGAASPFVDLPSDAYYTQAVLWGYQHEIVYGTGKTHFSPEEGCTRAQVVTFLYRYMGS